MVVLDNKMLVLFVALLIIGVSIAILYNLSIEPSSDIIIEGDNSFSSQDLINEIDDNILDEEGEIQIGEMI